jgi:hypothetical protein
MKRTDFEFTVSILLFFSVSVTGLLGFIQSQLELRKFVPHRYSAYVTLCLAAVHVYLNAGKIWKYLCRKIHPKSQT